MTVDVSVLNLIFKIHLKKAMVLINLYIFLIFIMTTVILPIRSMIFLRTFTLDKIFEHLRVLNISENLKG